MTTANKITLLRILLIPVFVCFFYARSGVESGDFFKVLATIIFIACAISDFFDGALARANKEVTDFGKFLDPVADKLLICAGYLCLMEFRDRTQVHGWMVIIILSREFLVTTLRSMASLKGVVIPASDSGKWKLGAQLTAIISALVFLSVEIILNSFDLATPASYFMWRRSSLLFFLNLFAVFVTIYSGMVYFFNFFPLIASVEGLTGIATLVSPTPPLSEPSVREKGIETDPLRVRNNLRALRDSREFPA